MNFFSNYNFLQLNDIKSKISSKEFSSTSLFEPQIIENLELYVLFADNFFLRND